LFSCSVNVKNAQIIPHPSDEINSGTSFLSDEGHALDIRIKLLALNK